MEIIKATEERREEIKSLLRSQKLPTEDLPEQLSHFYTAVENEKVIGLIGMEKYGQYGLLRSMVVHPDYRNRHIAETLIHTLEQGEASDNTTEMFLLTETADQYFSRKGYSAIDRNNVPDEIKQSSEFSHVCPVSAVVMRKQYKTITYNNVSKQLRSCKRT